MILFGQDPGRLARDGYHAGALAQESFHDRTADAARSPSYDRDLPGQSGHVYVAPFRLNPADIERIGDDLSNGGTEGFKQLPLEVMHGMLADFAALGVDNEAASAVAEAVQP